MGLFSRPNVEKLKDKKNVKGLIKALRGKDKFVRRKASEALGELGEPSAVEPLIQEMKDDDDDIRCEAIKSLGKIKDSSVVEPLIKALKDNNPWNREVAMESLGNTKDERAVKPLMQFIIEDKASSSLIKIGKSSVNPIIQALNDKDAKVRKRAAAILGSIRDRRAVEPLIEAFNDEDPFVRCTIATNLGELKDERAIEPLIQALKDKDGRVRIDSERAILRIGEPAIESLNKALGDENQRFNKTIKKLLDKMGKPIISDEKEADGVISRIKRILLKLPIIKEDNIAESRHRMINQSKSIHPSMFVGQMDEAINFITQMIKKTEAYILSCEGITNVKMAFLISNWPIRNEVLEIQYEQFWNDGTSAIYSEHAMRIGEDKYEIFGSEKSAKRMADF